MKNFEKELKSYCTLHWWNFGRKTLSFKGELKDLLKTQKITYSIKKTEKEGVYTFYFKSNFNISFKVKGTKNDFTHFAKQFIQMELVRMGDKSVLYVDTFWRPAVTVNF